MDGENAGLPMINLRLLIADDESQVRTFIETSLARDTLFISRSCASGGEALEIAAEWRPDLVLLDDMMPDVGGASVFKRLRADARTAPIPVVFLTARESVAEHYRELGAAGVLAKPLDSIELPAQIRRFARVEGALSPLRESFLRRLESDARALAAVRASLSDFAREPELRRVSEIAHALAGAGGIYGFAGITCESAALESVAENNLAGCAGHADIARALDRLLTRIGAV
jgi:CheY-like chemotaxis protein